jgi:arsenite methyltransferase
MTSVRPRGHYGIDAPWVPVMWVGFCVLYVGLCVAAATVWDAWWWIVAILAVAAAGFAAGAALFWYASLRGKFVIWNRLLADVDLRPGASVLDLGCGHGMVAVMTAVRDPGVEVTGIDLWRSVDQSGNSAEAAARNAEVNGVSGRVRFDTGDMTALPYADGSFDLVTASLAIHNIRTREGRRRALSEAARVLAADGRILIADISRTAEYAADLTAAGFEVRSTGLGWRGWWSGPWMATTAVVAQRPPA